MKKKRTISIKNPQLRKIRNNFRNLWKEWAHQLTIQLHSREEEVYYNESGKFKSEITGEEIERVRNISGKLSEIRNLVDKSICKCRRCVRTDQDMTYNPRDGAWYCVECYEEMRRWTAKKKTGTSILFP